MKLPRVPRAALVVLAFCFALVSGFSWVVASAPGSSPDDDYHLVSMWCPRPVTESCATKVVQGQLRVGVPEALPGSTCSSFHVDISQAMCNRYSDKRISYSLRYDDGNYPYGYYHFNHMFKPLGVQGLVIASRTANMVIALALLGSIGLLAPPKLRGAYLLAMGAAWMPIGVYFITSNNPSSWSITGVAGFSAGLLASLYASGRRRWYLLALACVGALLCYTSRADASFHIFVVALAICVACAKWRTHKVQLAVATLASVIGVYLMLASGSATIAEGHAEAVPMDQKIDVMEKNVTHLAKFFSGFWGLWAGAGWKDIPSDGYSGMIAILLVGFIVMLGAERIGWRKAMGAIITLGAMAGISVLVATPPAFPSMFAYQPRYAQPLLFAWLLPWLFLGSKRPLLSRSQAALYWAGMVAVNAVFMHKLIFRYTHGLVGGRHFLNLNFDVQWWWQDALLTPMSTWMVGALAFALASGIVIWLLFGPGAISAPAELAVPSGAAVADGAPEPVAKAAAVADGAGESAPSVAAKASAPEPAGTVEATVGSEADGASEVAADPKEISA